jgi:hypothetical protein
MENKAEYKGKEWRHEGLKSTKAHFEICNGTLINIIERDPDSPNYLKTKRQACLDNINWGKDITRQMAFPKSTKLGKHSEQISTIRRKDKYNIKNTTKQYLLNKQISKVRKQKFLERQGLKQEM